MTAIKTVALFQDRLLARKLKLRATGAVFAAGLGHEDWLGVGRTLSTVAGCAWWWIGDWVNWGEECIAPDCKSHHNGEGECQRRYGEKYRTALELFDYDYQSLRRMAYVCRSIELLRRRNNLSFAHHAEVAHLEASDQDRFLAAAVENKWTRSELRIAIRKANATEPEESSGRVSFVPHVWELEGIGWYEQQIDADPPPERKEALARQIEALIGKLQRLKARLTPTKESLMAVIPGR
jgi:hypothetical protein